MSRDHIATGGDLAGEAAAWFTRMQAPQASATERMQFSAWLQQSAAHVQEYLAVVSTWRLLEGTADAQRSADELIAAARAEQESTNIVDLRMPGSPVLARRSQTARRWRPAPAIAAALVLALAGVATWMGIEGRFSGGQYVTAVGEQRSFTLQDGSILRLNTRSEVRVRMDEDARHIDLLAGEAMFEVAADSDRPFRVHTDGAVVEALGTVFNVYRAADATRITVLEGRVRVSSDADTTATPVELAPRQQVQVSRAGTLGAGQPASLEKAVAWTDRRLIFENEALAGVVREFNRYNAQRLEIADEELAALRINANFRATDPQALVDFLRRAESVTAVADDGNVLLLSRQPR